MVIEEHINSILYKVKNLVYFDTIFALEEDFNRIGLTIQISGNNRVILCQIKEGRPSAKMVMEDYMFLGPFSMATGKHEISERLVSSITDFIMNKAGEPAAVQNVPRKWQQGVKTYGHVIRIMNEDVNVIAQDV